MMIMEELIGQIKALSDKTRMKIMWLLSRAQADLCICELMDTIEDSHCNISRHLKILKTAKLVQERKEGKWVYVRLIPPKDPFHEGLLQAIRSIPGDYFLGAVRRMDLRLVLRENDKCVCGLRSEKWRSALRAHHKDDMPHLNRIEREE
jgi:ArsR family transcriptional regulator